MSLHPHSPESREAISERLRLTREALGLTMSEWCRQCGIATNTWANYESGLRRISVDEAFKVARAFHITLDWIYRGRDEGLGYKVMDGLRRLQESEAADERKRA
jgi:transcriptional regulator with XRE-family HTH domain